MKKAISQTSTKRIPTAESIARMADKGQDISHFFKKLKMMPPLVTRVDVDSTGTMLDELDREENGLN
jgi:hypothetical protein